MRGTVSQVESAQRIKLRVNAEFDRVAAFERQQPRMDPPQRRRNRMTKDTLMYTVVDDAPAVNEEIWRAWVKKGKLRDAALARKVRMSGGIFLILLAFGTAFYFLAVRST